MNLKEITDLQKQLSNEIDSKDQNNNEFFRVVSSEVLTGHGNYDLTIKKENLSKKDIAKISVVVEKRGLCMTEIIDYIVIFKPQIMY